MVMDASEHAMRRIQVGLFLQSLLYVASGINHFVHTPFYVHIMPDHYSDPAMWVQGTGVAEIAGGLGLLVPKTRRVAAGGLAALLIVFFDVHIFMLQHPERFPEAPRWLLWARIPLQFVLIGWAGKYLFAESLGDDR